MSTTVSQEAILRSAILISLLLVAGSCQSDSDNPGLAGSRLDWSSASCAIALTPHVGEDELDRRIHSLQSSLPASRTRDADLERLGWLYVSKARVSFDPGYYVLAEKTAACLKLKVGTDAPAALLLEGHVLHQQHRFQEAGRIARRLVQERGLSYDYGLLGDVLQEQGRLSEAAQAYQRMIDQKPDPRAYSRVAHLRWLKGDLPGAVQLMEAAAGAGGRDREAQAWALTRLASLQLQGGELGDARRSVAKALSLQPGYAAAQLVLGRIHLALEEWEPAVQALGEAAAANPLPEYQWALAEGLTRLDRIEESRHIRQTLAVRGPQEDPRTTSLYWATTGREVERALELARRELEVRQDVFTLDALAWALRAAGQLEEARVAMDRALSEGTRDARLFLHAGLIAADLGRGQEASSWLSQAQRMRQTLLPSERDLLKRALTEL